MISCVFCLVSCGIACASAVQQQNLNKSTCIQHSDSRKTFAVPTQHFNTIYLHFGHMSSMSGGGGAAMLDVFSVLSLACLPTADCIPNRALRAWRYSLVCVLFAADFDFVSVISRGIIISSTTTATK